MRNCRYLLPLALLLAACSPKTSIECTVEGAPQADIAVKLLDVNVYKVLDTFRTDASGRMRCGVDVKAGQPEFIYLFRADRKIASLLLSAGERVTVKTDTLGRYQVEGSPESALLADVERRMSTFSQTVNSTDDPAGITAAYLSYYRECTRYVMENPTSLTVVPVLFQQLDENTPVFSQYTDAILFRKTVDSLKTVYPESRYVKALEKETVRRENAMQMQTMIGNAGTLGYPDLNLPDVNGQKVLLSSIEAKAVLLHFWDSSVPEDKMFNLDVLKPVWERWAGRGLQIYAVDVNTDKATWASVLRAQNLPWVNVNDGLGASSPAVRLYNVGSVPVSFLLSGGGLTASVNGEKALDKELSRILK
ncbi:MAG: TlpA family protein disulfide reductase [Bacteroidales bacterium]|nr:TlpA family protein disulfide reductase [Bacteroidales bacterium]